MTKSKPTQEPARKKKTGGSRLGTRWISNRDGVCVSWPTLPGAGIFGGFGLLACIVLGTCIFFFPEHVPVKFHFNGVWIVLGFILSITLLISSQLLRESCSLSRQKAERTRWPGLLRPRQAVPPNQVINVVIQMDEIVGEDTTYVGTVKLRVRRPDGIEWWNLGSNLDWGQAVSIGKCLSRFVDVRVIRADQSCGKHC